MHGLIITGALRQKSCSLWLTGDLHLPSPHLQDGSRLRLLIRPWPPPPSWPAHPSRAGGGCIGGLPLATACIRDR